MHQIAYFLSITPNSSTIFVFINETPKRQYCYYYLKPEHSFIMKKRILYIIFCLLLTATSKLTYAQLNTIGFEKLDSLQKKEERHIIVFIHTCWCNNCLLMQKTTLKKKVIQNELNNSFYFVELDAENKEDINFRGHVFKYKSASRLHELAEELGTKEGRVSFPALCFLNSKFEIIHQHNGFLSADDFLKVLKALKELKQ